MSLTSRTQRINTLNLILRELPPTIVLIVFMYLKHPSLQQLDYICH
jgi:hypothetical protein